MTNFKGIHPDDELIREPGKFQPGILGDLLFIFSEANARLLEMGSNHVRTGVSKHDEIRETARVTKEALEMWLANGDPQVIWDHLRHSFAKLGYSKVQHLDPSD